jgi:hypothetical protein
MAARLRAGPSTSDPSNGGTISPIPPTDPVARPSPRATRTTTTAARTPSRLIAFVSSARGRARSHRRTKSGNAKAPGTVLVSDSARRADTPGSARGVRERRQQRERRSGTRVVGQQDFGGINPGTNRTPRRRPPAGPQDAHPQESVAGNVFSVTSANEHVNRCQAAKLIADE